MKTKKTKLRREAYLEPWAFSFVKDFKKEFNGTKFVYFLGEEFLGKKQNDYEIISRLAGYTPSFSAFQSEFDSKLIGRRENIPGLGKRNLIVTNFGKDIRFGYENFDEKHFTQIQYKVNVGTKSLLESLEKEGLLKEIDFLIYSPDLIGIPGHLHSSKKDLEKFSFGEDWKIHKEIKKLSEKYGVDFLHKEQSIYEKDIVPYSLYEYLRNKNLGLFEK